MVEAEEEPEEPESSARKSTLADLYDLVAGARALVVDVTPGMCAASLTQPAIFLFGLRDGGGACAL